MKFTGLIASAATVLAAGWLAASPASAQAPAKPNIVFIMGDDIGWFNIGAYHQGIMAGRTPNLDQLAAEGMRFTDYYAEASCTAGRANFITGELPIRTGLTTVGQAGSPIGMPAEAPTIATALKSMGYATGQFGKNHLGDLNEFLPTVHGFDEFFGYLYHLDAMEDPCASATTRRTLKDKVGPRNMVHTLGDRRRRPDRAAALGQGRQAEDRGRRHALSRSGWRPSTTRSSTTRSSSSTRPRPTTSRSSSGSTRRACTSSRTSRDKYESDAQRRRTAGAIQEAGMAQLDDIVGSVMKKLKDMGLDDNTIVVFTTDNGAENFTWPDGGQTPFAGGKGTALEGGFRVPAIVRWPGKVPAGKVENGIISGPRLVPDASSPRPAIRTSSTSCKKGKQLGDQTYKVHLDGYDQMDLITGKGPSKRHEIFYFTESTLWRGAHRRLQVPLHRSAERLARRHGQGRLADPGQPPPRSVRAHRACPTATSGSLAFYNWFVYEFWRFVFVQQEVGEGRPDLRSSSRRCRRARASTSKPSRSRSRRPIAVARRQVADAARGRAPTFRALV